MSLIAAFITSPLGNAVKAVLLPHLPELNLMKIVAD